MCSLVFSLCLSPSLSRSFSAVLLCVVLCIPGSVCSCLCCHLGWLVGGIVCACYVTLVPVLSCTTVWLFDISCSFQVVSIHMSRNCSCVDCVRYFVACRVWWMTCMALIAALHCCSHSLLVTQSLFCVFVFVLFVLVLWFCNCLCVRWLCSLLCCCRVWWTFHVGDCDFTLVLTLCLYIVLSCIALCCSCFVGVVVVWFVV